MTRGGEARAAACGRRPMPVLEALHARAAAALAERAVREGELTPVQVARVVAGVLPRRLGRWLRRRLAGSGWLAAEAVVAADALDRPECPAALRGPRAALVRLALFGLPGQGLASRDKHRNIVYQQLCAEIMRTAVDPASLQAVANRALNHPDAAADALLASMLRSFIAEREAALRAARPTPGQEQREHEEESKLKHAFEAPGGARFPTRAEVLGALARVLGEFDVAVAQFDEGRAERALGRLRELRRRYPVHIPAGELQRCEEQHDRFLKRAATYRRQIQELAGQAAAAAARGDEKTATWIIRRLNAIHSLLPTLLPSERVEQLQAQIARSGQRAAVRETAEQLHERQREVVTEIKNLAGVIHRFHQVARGTPRDSPVYRRAEADYRAAVERIRALDTEWLAGLILQLETLIEDLDDPGGQMQSKLDEFIIKVRTALNRLRLEIRAIQAETAAARTAGGVPGRPAADGSAPSAGGPPAGGPVAPPADGVPPAAGPAGPAG